MALKVGTRIEVGIGGHSPRWERAVIRRRTKIMGGLPAGYHPVRFDIDGAELLVHESGFRVVDNRAKAES